MSPLSQLGGVLVRYDQMRHSFEALNRMMGLPEEQGAEANPLHLPHIKGAIEFKDVVFRYPGEDTAVLDGISFRIAAGEHVAVLGKVGSGKSTVLRLAQALYRPDQGYIRVDDLDLRQIDLNDLRRQIGYVPQDMVLFHGTVRANLVQGMPHATDEQVLRAAKRTGLIEAIRKWPRGFGQPVGERGFNLSGGQRQLIALARAIIAEPPILLFDEPTSHLDNAVEKQFLDHMRDFCRGRTLVLVTHRAALMQLVDRIILIDKNKVVADGPRDDVLALLAGTKAKAAE
jgi:ATP-binding cassette subfamily C protein LapB